MVDESDTLVERTKRRFMNRVIPWMEQGVNCSFIELNGRFRAGKYRENRIMSQHTLAQLFKDMGDTIDETYYDVESDVGSHSPSSGVVAPTVLSRPRYNVGWLPVDHVGLAHALRMERFFDILDQYLRLVVHDKERLRLLEETADHLFQYPEIPKPRTLRCDSPTLLPLLLPCLYENDIHFVLSFVDNEHQGYGRFWDLDGRDTDAPVAVRRSCRIADLPRTNYARFFK